MLPIAGKAILKIRTQRPPSPHAAVLDMLLNVFPSVKMVTEEGVKPQDLTRGGRQSTAGGGPCLVNSVTTLGPTLTKKLFRLSTETSGITLCIPFFLSTTERIFCQTVAGPCSSIQFCTSFLVSLRMAERTARLRSLYSLESRPTSLRAIRR